jgi:hypothetical protein
MGLSHNDANIQFYGFQSIPDAAHGGKNGPNGDVYFYPHTQVDAQVMYRLPHRRDLQIIASFLNLTNEVFGFYQAANSSQSSANTTTEPTLSAYAGRWGPAT